MGWTAFRAPSSLTRIESELGVSLEPAALSQAETPHDLLRAIRSPAPASASSASRPEPTRDDSRIEYLPATLDTLVDVLDWHAERHGERLLVTIESQHGAAAHLTYARLRIDALAVAAGLVERGCSAGDAVAVMLPTGSEFFAAFYGALYAGCVPVPLYPPARLAQLEDHLQRSVAILRNAEATAAAHGAPGEAFRAAAARALRNAAGHHNHRRPRGSARAGGAPCHQRRFDGLPSIHLGQHRQPQRRRAQPRQPARQCAGDVARFARQQRRHLRVLVAAVSRHGSDRRVHRKPGRRLSAGADVAARISRQAVTLAVGDPQASRNLVGGAELRLRTVREPCRRRRARRARSRLVATRLQRCGAGERLHARTLRVALRPLRLQARSHVHGIRPRRRRARRDLPAARTRADDRLPSTATH